MSLYGDDGLTSLQQPGVGQYLPRSASYLIRSLDVRRKLVRAQSSEFSSNVNLDGSSTVNIPLFTDGIYDPRDAYITYDVNVVGGANQDVIAVAPSVFNRLEMIFGGVHTAQVNNYHILANLRRKYECSESDMLGSAQASGCVIASNVLKKNLAGNTVGTGAGARAYTVVSPGANTATITRQESMNKDLLLGCGRFIPFGAMPAVDMTLTCAEANDVVFTANASALATGANPTSANVSRVALYMYKVKLPMAYEQILGELVASSSGLNIVYPSYQSLRQVESSGATTQFRVASKTSIDSVFMAPQTADRTVEHALSTTALASNDVEANANVLYKAFNVRMDGEDLSSTGLGCSTGADSVWQAYHTAREIMGSGLNYNKNQSFGDISAGADLRFNNFLTDMFIVGAQLAHVFDEEDDIAQALVGARAPTTMNFEFEPDVTTVSAVASTNKFLFAKKKELLTIRPNRTIEILT
jgi:hypothetical protein